MNIVGQTFEEARKRIRNINWEYEDDFRPSHPLLAAEFFRRGNLFLDYIHKDPDSRFTVFSAIHEIGADLPINIKETCPELEQITIGWTAQYFCTFYLEWAYLVDQGEPIAVQFQDLYDPIIKLYERGGRIYYHHHELICGGSGFSRNLANFRDIPPKDIRDEALEEEDKVWFLKKNNR